MNQPDPDNLNEPFGDSEQLPPAEAQPVGVEELLRRIDAAIERVTSGRGEMRIPADPTDPDLVLADAGNWIKQAALAQQGGNPKPRETDDVQ